MGMVGQRTHGVFATIDTQCSAECPVNSFFNGVIEEIRQGRDDRETELYIVLAFHTRKA